MRQTLTRLLVLTMSTVLLFLLMNGCRKADRTSSPAGDETVQQTTTASRFEHRRNITMPAGVVRNGTAHPMPAAPSVQVNGGGGGGGNTPGCTNYTNTIQFTYLGYADWGDDCFDDRDFLMSWYLDMPADITPLPGSTNTKAYWGFSYQGTFTNIPLTITFHSSYTHPVENITMYKYLVTYTFNMSNSDWCNHEYVLHYLNIETDCSYAQIVTPNMYGPMNDNLDIMGAYQPSVYNAINATGGNPVVHRFQAFPLFLVCQPCHGPEYGLSTNHQFRYRLQGTTTWTTITRTDLLSFYVNVAAGTYEYESRGIIDAYGTYTNWTTTATVVVL